MQLLDLINQRTNGPVNAHLISGPSRSTQTIMAKLFLYKFLVCLFVLMLNVLVNNFSVMSGRSHRFLCITSTFRGVNVSLLKDTTWRR